MEAVAVTAEHRDNLAAGGAATESVETVDATAACPICGSINLVEFAGRSGARCEECDALERHRALARQMADLLRDGAQRAALEVGPASPRVFGGFLREHGWRYTCVDQSRRGNPNDPRAVGFIDHETDLCDLSMFAEDSVQLVIVQHVIEEIPDYELAVAEIARVLAPGGTALLEIPFDPRLERSERQPPNHFGNVWRFGADLPDRLRAHFSEVELVGLHEAEYFGRLLVCRAR
ncbi:MAG: class I SAM-dependent methyltransferase [Solirubrobacterales bacterium]